MSDKEYKSHFDERVTMLQDQSLRISNSMKAFKPVKETIEIVATYLFIGVMWILISDKVLNFFIRDIELFKQIQLYKGWFYVLITAAVFFFIIKKRMVLFAQAHQRTVEGYEELSAANEELIAMEEELNQQYDEVKKHRDALAASDRRYKLAVEGANDGIWEWDNESGVYFFSVRWKTAFGYDEHELSNTIEAFRTLLHPDDLEITISAINAYLASKQGIYENTYRLRCKDGSYRWVLSRGKAIWDSNGKALCFAGSHTDITEKMQIQEKLRRESEMLENIFADTSMIIVVLDNDAKILDFNYSAELLTGYNKKEVIGADAMQVLLHESQRVDMKKVFDSIITNKALKDIEVPIRCKDGSIKTVILNNTLMHNQDGDVQGVVSIGFDITERRNMEKNLHKLAYYDVLTQLPNRVWFEQQLDQLIVQAKDENSKIAVIYLDIDNFKNINDTVGHAAGDKFLVYIASILSHHIKSPNSVARLSGDEFAILLTDTTNNEQVELTVATLLKFLRRPWVLEKQKFFISVSIGITIYPEQGEDLICLMQNADTALFHIKESGKDGYCFYNASMKEKTWKHIQMNAELIHAIKNEAFSLYYQPQIDLKTNEIVGVEALIRWVDPEKGFIPPMEFIPFAEETGHIHSISKWVLKTACDQAKAWKEKGYERVKIAVNLSGKTLTQQSLVQDIQDIMQQYHINGNEMELEITETSIIADINHSVDILKQLKQLGLVISLDDFGTGYSSLTYLKKLPIDILKMDREFIKNIVSGDDECFIVKTVIELAHNMGLKVVAEGIETKEQLEVLKKNGCDIAQGYYFSKPVSAPELEELLKSSQGGKHE